MKKWALVVFVLLASSVAAAADGDPQAGKAKSAACAGCHGVDGNSIQPIYPKLAGQHAKYLELAMKAYRSKQRKGGNTAMMYPMVANLSDQDIKDLAAYFSQQTPK